MVYVVEISFCTKKTPYVDKTLYKINEICDRYECIDNYHIVETLGEKYNHDSIYVINCSFDSESEDVNEDNIYYHIQFIEFLKEVKKNKEYNIDMVMNNNDNVVDCNVLYMSPYYLKNMPKENKKSYIIAQQNRSYSESDYMILKEFTNELSKYNNEFVEKHLKFKISYKDYLSILNKNQG